MVPMKMRHQDVDIFGHFGAHRYQLFSQISYSRTCVANDAFVSVDDLNAWCIRTIARFEVERQVFDKSVQIRLVPKVVFDGQF